MKTNFKRIMGLLLAIIMVVTMLPATVLADDSATVPTGASFVVEGQKYYLTDVTAVGDNGELYYMIVNGNQLASQRGNETYLSTTIDTVNSTATDKYFNININAMYGVPLVSRLGEYGTSVEIGSLEDSFFPSTVFGNHIKEHDWNLASDWEWSDGSTVDLYFKSKIGMPDYYEMASVMAKDTLDMYKSAYICTRTYRNYYDSKEMRLIDFNGSEQRANYCMASDNLTASENSRRGSFFFSAFVSEEWFKTTKIEVGTMAEDVRAFLAEKFTTLDLEDAGYTEEEFEIIGVKEPAYSDGTVFVADGQTYYLTDVTTVGEDGKTYYMIVNANHLVSDRGNESYISTTVDEVNSTETDKYFNVTLNANWGVPLVTKSASYASSVAIEDFENSFFPASVFGNYIKEHDWDLAKDWEWSDGSTVDLYFKSKIGLPEYYEMLDIMSKDTLEMHKSAYISTRTFRNYYGSREMRLLSFAGEEIRTHYCMALDNLTATENSRKGSFFLSAFVSKDFFKTPKLDLADMSEYVRDFIVSNFTKAELRREGYTDAQLATLGFPPNTAPVSGVMFDETEASVNVGYSLQLNAHVLPLYEAGNENMFWESDDTSIATVDPSGKVTGISSGVATITVTTEEGGYTATCQVNVSSGAEFYVSASNGDDTNPGTFDEPFATIQKAVDSMNLDDVVYVREGVYEETVKFNKSGSEIAPLTIKAYQDEEVVVTGLKKVTGWTVDKTVGSNTIYKAYAGKQFNKDDMVFFNRSYVDYAKWPNNTGDNNNNRGTSHDSSHPGLNDDWLFPTWGSVDSASGVPSGETLYNKYYGTIYDSELTFAADELVGANMLTFSGKGWYMYSGEITKSIVGAFDIRGTMQFHEYYRPTRGNQYYLYGAKCLLDYQNEWYSDENGYLYIITPDGSDPNNAIVEVNARENAVEFNGNGYINIEGIDFFAGRLRTEGSDGLKLINISNSYVSSGPNISGDNNLLADSTIDHTVSNFLRVGGHNNKIINNLFEYGCADGTGEAINLRDSMDAVLAYNTLRFAGAKGIDINNRGRALITYNDISYCSAVCRDNGAMYVAYGDCSSTEVSYNWTHDGMTDSTAGIYPDLNSSNIIIHHNVVWNVPWGYQLNGPNVGILAYNNTFAARASNSNGQEASIDDDLWSVNNLYTSSCVLYHYNLKQQAGTYTESKTYHYEVTQFNDRESNSIINALKANAFYPTESDTNVVDQGVIIKNINDDYVGNAPDKGAYEYGAEKWVPGHDFTDTTRKYAEYKRTEQVPFMNYVHSGGFEYDVNQSPWVKTGVQSATTLHRTSPTYTENAAVRLGDAGVRLGASSTIAGTDGLEQTITNLKPYTTYVFSASGRIDSNTGTNPITMQVKGAAAASDEELVFDSYKWQDKYMEFTTGKDGTVTISISKPAGGYGYVDVVMVYETSGISASDSVPECSEAYAELFTFEYDGKSFTILENGPDSSFVICNDYYDAATAFDTKKNQKFNPSDSANIAYKLANSIALPSEISENVVTDHIWKTEAGAETGNAPLDYETETGISLLSYGELIHYGNKITKTQGNWWLRSANNTKGYAMYVNNDSVLAAQASTEQNIRPVFYLDNSFFTDVVLDVDLMGTQVQMFLLNHFGEQALLDAGYTAEDIEKISGTVIPVTDSPNYVKLADGTELLYNGSVVVGKNTYFGFVLPVDYAGTSSTQGVIFAKDSSDPAGKPLDSTLYGEYLLTTKDVSKSSGTTLDTAVKADLPDAIVDNLYLKTWDAGLAYVTNEGEGTASSKTYISLPSQQDMQTHSSYLMSLATDNTNGKTTPEQSYSVYNAILRDAAGYSAKAYDFSTMNIVNTAEKTPYFAGSVFPVFYVDANFLKEVKVDVNSLGSQAKSMFGNLFLAGDLGHLYTSDELSKLGVSLYNTISKGSSFAGAKFKAGGKDFILMEDTMVINGKKYIGVMSTEYTSATWKKAAIQLTYLTENVAGATGVDIPVVMNIKNTGNGSVTDIQTKSSNFSAFGSYIVPNSTEWVLSRANSSKLYYTGSVGIPSDSMYKRVFAKDALAYGSGDSSFVTGSYGFYAGSYYMSDVSATTGQSAGGNPHVNKDNNSSSSNSAGGTWYFMTYVSEDYFKNNNMDISTVGTYAREILRNNFTEDDLKGWNQENIDLLFYGAYDCEGAGLVVKKSVDAENKLMDVSVCVNNNGDVPVAKGTMLIIAVYENGKLAGLKFKTLDKAVGANSMTTFITESFSVEDASADYTAKAMLWEGFKPICSVAAE